MSEHKILFGDIVTDKDGYYYVVVGTDTKTTPWTMIDAFLVDQDPAYELKRLNTKIGVLQSRIFKVKVADFEKKYKFHSYLPMNGDIFKLSVKPLCPILVLTLSCAQVTKNGDDEIVDTFMSDEDRLIYKNKDYKLQGYAVRYLIIGGPDIPDDERRKIYEEMEKKRTDKNNHDEKRMYIEDWLRLKPERVSENEDGLVDGYDKDFKCPKLHDNLNLRF